MSEEKKDVVVDEEEEKINDDEKEQKQDDDKKDDEKKEDFEKDSETVPSSKYNQELRKRREAEARIKELERLGYKKSDDQEEEDEDNDKGEDDDKAEDDKKEAPWRSEIDEIKQVLSKKESDERKAARQSFFENHPQYLNDAEKWNELLEEIDNSFNPNSPDPYYTQLEKAHRIIADTAVDTSDIDAKKREMANDTSTGGDGERSDHSGEEFTAEDKQIMKEQGVSEDAMRALKKKQESGSMQIL